MKFEWDKTKNDKNIIDRRISFDQAKLIDFSTAIYEDDTRKDYGERRVVVYGLIATRLYILCFTPIHDGIRVISLRKANQREIRYYEKAAQTTNE